MARIIHVHARLETLDILVCCSETANIWVRARAEIVVKSRQTSAVSHVEFTRVRI